MRARRAFAGTNMIVNIKPLAPGKKMHFNISFSYVLNKTSHIRTGEVEKGSYFIAYFFPRIAVYDDVHGWNRIPYTGTQEFYNDFCNFDTRITVPKDYVVWATGTLQNSDSVLASKYIQRIKEAETNDGITTVIDSTDLQREISQRKIPPIPGILTRLMSPTSCLQPAIITFGNHRAWSLIPKQVNAHAWMQPLIQSTKTTSMSSTMLVRRSKR